MDAGNQRLAGLMAQFHVVSKPAPPKLVLPTRVMAILVEVGAKHGFLVEEIRGKSQKADVVHARWEVMYRLWMECRWLSKNAVGRMVCRDHSTVVHGVEQHALRKSLPKTREEYDCARESQDG